MARAQLQVSPGEQAVTVVLAMVRRLDLAIQELDRQVQDLPVALATCLRNDERDRGRSR